MVVQRSVKPRDGSGHQFGRLECQPLLGHEREGALFIEQLCLDFCGLGLARGGVINHVAPRAASDVARLFQADVRVSADREAVSLPCSRYFNRQNLEGALPTLLDALTSK